MLRRTDVTSNLRLQYGPAERQQNNPPRPLKNSQPASENLRGDAKDAALRAAGREPGAALKRHRYADPEAKPDFSKLYSQRRDYEIRPDGSSAGFLRKDFRETGENLMPTRPWISPASSMNFGDENSSIGRLSTPPPTNFSGKKNPGDITAQDRMRMATTRADYQDYTGQGGPATGGP